MLQIQKANDLWPTTLDPIEIFASILPKCPIHHKLTKIDTKKSERVALKSHFLKISFLIYTENTIRPHQIFCFIFTQMA